MIDLTASYGGCLIKNPLIIASGPTSSTPEMCKKAADAGWAGAVLKTEFSEDTPGWIWKKTGWPQFRLTGLTGRDKWKPKITKADIVRNGNKLGIKNLDYCLAPNLPAAQGAFFAGEEYVDYINKTKDLCGDDFKVIASIVAFTEKTWEKQCEMVNKSDADYVELNLGCPAVTVEGSEGGQKGMMRFGATISAYPDFLEKFTRFAIEHLDKKVIVKMGPQISDPLHSAQVIEKCGAQGIQFADAFFQPALKFDIETLKFFFPEYPTFTGIWGPWVLPYIAGNVAKFRLNGITIDIAACGGIRNAADIIQLIMCGASSVQSCIATIVEGVEVAKKWFNDIKEFMERKGYKSINEMRGVILGKIVQDASTLPTETPQIMGGPKPPKKMECNEDKCIACGLCESACFMGAIKVDGERAAINQDRCEACGLCESLCPANAITMASRY